MKTLFSDKSLRCQKKPSESGKGIRVVIGMSGKSMAEILKVCQALDRDRV